MRQAYEQLVYLSVPKYTVMITARDGRIVEAAPIVRRKWLGKTLEEFIRWHELQHGDSCLWKNMI